MVLRYQLVRASTSISQSFTLVMVSSLWLRVLSKRHIQLKFLNLNFFVRALFASRIKSHRTLRVWSISSLPAPLLAHHSYTMARFDARRRLELDSNAKSPNPLDKLIQRSILKIINHPEKQCRVESFLGAFLHCGWFLLYKDQKFELDDALLTLGFPIHPLFWSL